MDNSINFKGAFLIKQPTPALKDKLAPALKNMKKQILQNVKKEGDVLLVVRNNFDKELGDIILETKNVKFKYYPNLNTKSGFDPKKPEEALQLLRSASKKAIDTKEKLEQFFRTILKKPVDIVKLQANNLETVQKETYIDLTENCYRTNIDYKSGICSVYTMVKDPKTGKSSRHTLINITPPDKYGISYARYTPVSEYRNSRRVAEDKSMRRLAIKNGEVIFEYNQPASESFIKNEAEAKKHYVELMEKYKTNLANMRA